MATELREYSLQETEDGRYRYELERATLCVDRAAAETEVLERISVRGCGGQAATLHGPIPLTAYSTVEVAEVPITLEAGSAGASIMAIDGEPPKSEDAVEFPVNPEDPEEFPEP